MTLSSALQAAASGLGVSSKRAETVANNIANATADGYGRRSLSIQSALHGPGVRLAGVERHVDALVLAETRNAKAEQGQKSYTAAQLNRIEAAFGLAGKDEGLSAAIARFEASLLAASGDPSSETRLVQVVDAASALARAFKTTSDTIQTVRREADARIASDLERLSSGLNEVARTDRQITLFKSTGRDATSLLDHRQKTIDSIATIVPMREITSADGQTRLITTGGAVLLDGRAATFTFTPTPTITATGPAVGELQVNGKLVDMHGNGPLSGGTLSAAFDLRDALGPMLQSDLDALANDLATRLAAADRTLNPGQAGLLTDRGSATDAANTQGLSSRLTVNARVRPDADAETWGIRSGLGAAQAGPSGDAGVLRDLLSALSTAPDRPVDATARLGEKLSHRRLSAESDALSARMRAETMGAELAKSGVDTDAELQDLMQIETAYAANARVLQAIDEMLSYLLAR